MTYDETATLCARIQAVYGGPWSEAKVAEWSRALAEMTASRAGAALDAWCRESRFAPHPSDLRACAPGTASVTRTEGGERTYSCPRCLDDGWISGRIEVTDGSCAGRVYSVVSPCTCATGQARSKAVRKGQINYRHVGIDTPIGQAAKPS